MTINASPPYPLFSVIIPTFNRATTIMRAVQSVLKQTYPSFELIVVDDGSSDDTAQLIKKILDNRLQYIYQANQGRSAARNAGAKIAKGNFITFLDSDDEVASTWLTSLASLLYKDVAVVCCGTKFINSETNEVEEIVLPKQLGASYANQAGLFYAGTFAVRRDVFHTIGGYVNVLAQGENTELGRRLSFYCVQQDLQIAYVPEALVLYYRNRTLDPNDQTYFKNSLEGATYMLEHHSTILYSAPHRYALTCGIAGVNAARLGQYKNARHFFLKAIASDPWHWKHYLRFALSLVPVLSRRYWLRV